MCSKITSADSCCPIARASQLIGDVWTILIVKELLAGPRRYSELERALHETEPVGDISSRTLTQRLKMLEEEKIVRRRVSKTTPPHSVYSLTARGQALSSVVEKLREFGEQFLS